MNKYEFFSEKELACKCGCGKGQFDMDVSFMERLISLRSFYGKPMPISSGFRCPGHNTAQSTTGDSGPHTTGHAVDVRVSGRDAFDLVKAAISTGFTGIGLKQHGAHGARFVHLDDLGGPVRPWVWTY